MKQRSMAQDTYDRVFLALKVIASLRENERLCTKHGELYVDTSGKLQCLLRWLSGESRASNIECLSHIFNNAFAIADSALQKEEMHKQSPCAQPPRSVVVDRMANLQLLAQCQRELVSAGTGLGNLVSTYREDTATVARLQLLLEKIADKLQLIAESLSHIEYRNGAPIHTSASEPQNASHGAASHSAASHEGECAGDCTFDMEDRAAALGMSPGALSLLDKVTSYPASSKISQVLGAAAAAVGYQQASDAHFKELQKLHGEVASIQHLMPPLPPQRAVSTAAPPSETCSDLTEEEEEA